MLHKLYAAHMSSLKVTLLQVKSYFKDEKYASLLRN